MRPCRNTANFVEIALAADRAYLIGMTVTACSIASSCKPEATCRFHLLVSDFTDSDKNLIRRKIQEIKKNCEVCFYDISGNDLSYLPQYASSRMTYARLMLPNLLKDIDYVIYADVDMLWLDDISDLWAVRRDVALVSCVREQAQKTLEQEEAWFTANGLAFNRKTYFCAGVSFYNLSAIRAERAFDDVFEFGRKYHGFNCADQSMMYGALGNRVGHLSDRWQTFPRNGIPVSPGTPLVLHYAGEVPWKYSKITRMLTDTQLLWFMACSKFLEESTWDSLRRFYSGTEIVTYRLIFLLMFRIWPISLVSPLFLRIIGVKRFRESLRNRELYLNPIASCNHHATSALNRH